MFRRAIYPIAAVAIVASVAAAQTRITTVEDYAALMKATAQANAATGKAIGSAAYGDARTSLATVRQNFVALQAFWTERKRDDAIGIVKDALTRLDAIDTMLAAGTVDQVGAQAATKAFAGNVCAACHKLYREGDNQTGFRFRPGVF